MTAASPLGAWLPFIGPIVVAAIGVIAGQRYAAKRSAQVEDRKVDLSVYKDQVDGWRRDVDELRKDRDEDRKTHTAELARLRHRVDELEQALDQDRERIRRLSADLLAISTWARGLVRLLEQAQIDFPPSPVDLGTDPRLRLPRPASERPETD